MSTVKVTNLQNAGSSSVNMTLDTAGNAAVAGTMAMGSSFLRNRIINGDMRIDQRNAGASVTPTANTYTLDRWQAVLSAASKYSVQRNAGAVTPPAGHKYYMGITSLAATSLAAGDFYYVQHKIEGYNVGDLGWGAAGAQSVTLSFWVRSSLTGTFGGGVSNDGSARSYPFTYTISSANTWEQKTVTIPGDTSGTWLTDSNIGLRLYFGLGVGTTYSGTAGAWASALYVSATGATSVVGTNAATWYITGVQLEAGSVATPFERRLYGQELALCQRYYEKSFNIDFAPANGGSGTTFSASGGEPVSVFSQGNVVNVSYRFMVQKRSAPTVNYYGNSTGQVAVANTSASITWTTVAGNINTNATQVGLCTYNSTSAFQHITFHYAANAEL